MDVKDQVTMAERVYKAMCAELALDAGHVASMELFWSADGAPELTVRRRILPV